METITTIAELRERTRAWRQKGQRIGLVPTMGYLHEGHLQLVDVAREQADRLVATIFVNPLQFGPAEDLDRYPRDLSRDSALLKERSADLLFAPTADQMYPTPPAMRIDPGPLGTRWEGAVRPGHFSGVLTVVAKLFHLVEPDVACFGQKDIQQATLIRRMVKELDWPIEIVLTPIVREPDGLALSSRNVYLGTEPRRQARVLSRALRAASDRWKAGEMRAAALEAAAQSEFATEPAVRADYIAIVDPVDMTPVDVAPAGTIIALAARVGPTRLIDNVILGQDAFPVVGDPTG